MRALHLQYKLAMGSNGSNSSRFERQHEKQMLFKMNLFTFSSYLNPALAVCKKRTTQDDGR